MKTKTISMTLSIIAAAFVSGNVMAATAATTKNPTILAHGMMGFDSLVGIQYFGDEWGVSVSDSCGFLEVGCNSWVSSAQDSKTYAFQVTGLQSSEVRGDELYNHARNVLATTGAQKVNLVGHSQGGLDIRKVSHRLKTAFGTNKVGSLISISSPHRGSPFAKKALDTYARDSNGVFCKSKADPAACNSAVAALADGFYDLVNGSSGANDAIWSLAQLMYDDYDANDGRVTGVKAFNAKYPGAGTADYIASVITAQDDSNQGPVIAAMHLVTRISNIDGDGYCLDDCDKDGAAGKGNGNIYDNDDDGLVGINSQQFGIRLSYAANDWSCNYLVVCSDPLDTFTEVTTLGSVTNLNAPSSAQMTSRTGVMYQDHVDVTGLGPDLLDEHEMYAALFDLMAKKGT